MPATPTPRLQLPIPAESDPADVPADIAKLANRLDLVVAAIPPTGASLPGSPVDGQEACVTADATNGIVWRFRYRAAATAHKWEFVGGTPLIAAQSDTSEDWGPGGAYSDFDNPVQVTVPLLGDYLIEYAAYIATASASTGGAVGVSVGGAVATDTNAVSIGGGTSLGISVASGVRWNSIAAASVVKLQGKATGSGIISVGAAWLTVAPIRVG